MLTYSFCNKKMKFILKIQIINEYMCVNVYKVQRKYKKKVYNFVAFQHYYNVREQFQLQVACNNFQKFTVVKVWESKIT